VAVLEFRAYPNRPPLSPGQIEFSQRLHHIKQVGLGNAGWFDSGFAIWCQDKTVLCRTANAQDFWGFGFCRDGLYEDETVRKNGSDAGIPDTPII
jgi:hypothetical protein